MTFEPKKAHKFGYVIRVKENTKVAGLAYTEKLNRYRNIIYAISITNQ